MRHAALSVQRDMSHKRCVTRCYTYRELTAPSNVCTALRMPPWLTQLENTMRGPSHPTRSPSHPARCSAVKAGESQANRGSLAASSRRARASFCPSFSLSQWLNTVMCACAANSNTCVDTPDGNVCSDTVAGVTGTQGGHHHQSTHGSQ